MKKSLKILSLILLVTLLVTGCGKDKTKEEPSNPVDDNTVVITEEQVVEGLKFSNFALIYENDKSFIMLDVTNTTENAISLNLVNIKLFDKDNNVMDEIKGYAGEKIEPNQTNKVSINSNKDLRGTKRIECSIVK